MKKILTWAGIAFLLFFLISSPHQAGDVVRGIGGALWTAGDSVRTFMAGLFR